jgi:hypothetical protein
MNRFLARIELHGKTDRPITGDDYYKLDQEMIRRGFEKSIGASNGVQHSLPTAEYHKTSDELIAEILHEAKDAAYEVQASSETIRSYSVIVTHYVEATGYNLKEIKKSA